MAPDMLQENASYLVLERERINLSPNLEMSFHNSGVFFPIGVFWSSGKPDFSQQNWSRDGNMPSENVSHLQQMSRESFPHASMRESLSRPRTAQLIIKVIKDEERGAEKQPE